MSAKPTLTDRAESGKQLSVQRTGIADGRAIEKLLPEQKIVNEQIVEIMILSSKENVKPEQKPINDSTADNSQVSPAIDNTNVVCQGGKFCYCQTQIEGGKYCKKQCDHCKEYFAPLEEKQKVRQMLEKKLEKIEKELNKCRISTLEDGWQTQRYAKKARKWDYYAQEKFKIQSKLEEL